MEILLERTGRAVAKCWERAEAATTFAIAQKHPHPSEEEITFIFFGELRDAVQKASNARELEQAFVTDLRTQLPGLSADGVRQIPGLVARVNQHGRWHEGHKSGSDLGVVITRPIVHKHAGGHSVEITRGHARGLLAQAKLGKIRKPNSERFKFRGLTGTQKRIIPKHHSYYWLLLYRLQDLDMNLEPFGWQSCRDRSVGEISDWLQSGTFPAEMSSATLIQKLSTGGVGTDSLSVVEALIDPEASQPRSVEIEVFWPEGAGPRTAILLQQPAESRIVRVSRG